MKPEFFQIGKKAILSQKVWDPLDGLHMAQAFIFNINQDVIQVDNVENIEFFGQRLVDVALEAGRSVG